MIMHTIISVIDMSPSDPAALVNPLESVPPSIQERTFADFTGRETHFAMYRYPPRFDTPAHRQTVLQRARDLLHADPKDQPDYNLLLMDCDAFAVYCWTGRYIKDHEDPVKYFPLSRYLDQLAKPCSKLLGGPADRRNYLFKQ